ncbi:hypothetical protein ACFSUS_04565 [Spirosoma soli]|uniref:Uncharacterized protein n=1 Tax=Spirosoma soli TaxID=1770529 RepID=A0ABW5M0T3_9BACT
MNTYRPLISWLLIGSQLLGCRDDQVAPQLPPETQVGQKTFGCLVNGKVWLPGGKIAAWRLGGQKSNLEVTTGLSPDCKSTYLQVHAQINQGEKWINFFKVGITQTGTYSLGVDSTSSVSYRGEELPVSCRDYYTDRRNSHGRIIEGELTLTRYDQVVAGRFSFVFVQPNCDTIRITDGRFDY